MKSVLGLVLVICFALSCGPSSSTGNQSGVSSSPTGDTAITDDGTGAAKGAETTPRDSSNNQQLQ